MKTPNSTFKQHNDLFHRFEGNPILSPTDWPYPANAVFNPAAVSLNSHTLVLARVEDRRGFSHLTAARSEDGLTNWQIDPEPLLSPDPDAHEERWGLEDARIVRMADSGEFAITCVSFSVGGPLVSLIMTEDFKTFKRMGTPFPPEDKDACLFPRLFNGLYAMIHRPIIRGQAHIWISFSPDLHYWGEHQILIPVRDGWWDCHRVGLATQPIETDAGWLIIYHGVRVTPAGQVYRVGLALLDLNDPRKLIRRCDEWVFAPCMPYELTGDVPGVVFPTGAVVDKKTNQLRLYYGAADTCIAVAIADLDAVLEYASTCPLP